MPRRILVGSDALARETRTGHAGGAARTPIGSDARATDPTTTALYPAMHAAKPVPFDAPRLRDADAACPIVVRPRARAGRRY